METRTIIPGRSTPAIRNTPKGHFWTIAMARRTLPAAASHALPAKAGAGGKKRERKSIKICRFQVRRNEPIRLGVVRADAVHHVTTVTEELPALRWPFPPGDQFIIHLDALRPRMEALADSVGGTRLTQVLLKPPLQIPANSSAEPEISRKFLPRAAIHAGWVSCSK